MRKIFLLIFSIVLFISSCTNDESSSDPVSFKEKDLIGKWQIQRKVIYNNLADIISDNKIIYNDCTKDTYTEFLENKTIKYLSSEQNELNECIIEENNDYKWFIKDNELVTANEKTGINEYYPIIILSDNQFSITSKSIDENNNPILIRLFYIKHN